MSSPFREAPLAARPYYPALTGLRALAAYMVFVLHARSPAMPPWLGNIASQFYVGVSLFFVLSGFVIATRYHGTVQLTYVWWRQYLWRRFARIFPLYLLLNGVLLFVLYGQFPPGQGMHTLALMLLSQSLLRGFSSTLKFVGLPQGWSLTVEECFYLAAPLLLVAWARYASRGAAGFVAVVIGSGLLLTYLCAGHPALHGFFGSYYHLINFTFFGRVLEFVVGVGLARWWALRPAPQRAPRWPWRTLGGGLLMGLAIGLLAKLDSPSTFYDGLLDPAAIAVHLLLFPAGAVVLLAGLLAERSWLRAILSTRLLGVLGRSSYAFYLLHIGFFSLWWHSSRFEGSSMLWQFLALVGLSLGCHYWVEEPLRRLLLRRGRPQHVAAYVPSGASQQ